MDHTMTKNPDSIPYNIWPAEALRLAEREAADSLGLTLFELMQRAGEAAFQLASRAYPASAHWLIPLRTWQQRRRRICCRASGTGRGAAGDAAGGRE